MKTQEQFFQEHQVDGVLPESKLAELALLTEGDTVVSTTDGSVPDAATTTAKTPDTPAPADKKDGEPAATPAPAPAAETPQVILAKDGVHTIPYEKLTEARQEAQTAKQRADELAAEVEALKKASSAAPAPAAAPAATPAAPAADVKVDPALFGDYSEEALAKGINTLVSQLVEQRVAPVQAELSELKGKQGQAEQHAVVEAHRAHWASIYGAHKDFDSIVESAELKTFIESQPTFVRSAYQAVLEQGTAPEVIELFTTFKTVTGKTTAAAPAAEPERKGPAVDTAAAAQAAIDRAKSAVPASLSDVPGGGTVHTDEAAAMLELSPTALLARFEGKSPEQISAALAKAL